MLESPDMYTETTAYLQVDGDTSAFDVSQIAISEEATETPVAVDEVDTSVVGIPEDRTGDEDVMRSAANYSVISPDRALRAGQITTGEVVVDTDYRNNGSEIASQPIVETPENSQDLGNQLETMETPEQVLSPRVDEAIVVTPTLDFTNEESYPLVQIAEDVALSSQMSDKEADEMVTIAPAAPAPSMVAVPDMETFDQTLPDTPDRPSRLDEIMSSDAHNELAHDESVSGHNLAGDQVAEEVTPPVVGGGDDKPPIDNLPPAPGVPEEDPEEGDEVSSPHQHFASGQLRPTLRGLNEALTEAGVDPAPMLSPRQREALPMLLRTDLSNNEIAESLGYSTPSEVSRVAARIVERVVARAPEGTIPEGLVQPAGYVVPEELNLTVGGRLNAARLSKGIAMDAVMQQLEKSKSTLERFFSGKTHPNTTQIIRPLIDLLGIPPEEAAELLKEYKRERLQALGKLAEQKGEDQIG